MIQSAHWDIILTAYVVTGLTLTATTAWIVVEGRRLKTQLARLEALSPRAKERA
jgi:heme exporter protein CcmD